MLGHPYNPTPKSNRFRQVLKIHPKKPIHKKSKSLSIETKKSTSTTALPPCLLLGNIEALQLRIEDGVHGLHSLAAHSGLRFGTLELMMRTSLKYLKSHGFSMDFPIVNLMCFHMFSPPATETSRQPRMQWATLVSE